MKIGIILHPFSESEPAGLGRSILALVQSLFNHDHENEYTIYVKEKPIKPLTLPSNAKLAVIGNVALGFGLRKAPMSDVYIFNNPTLPLFFRPRRSIVIAHDFAYLYLNPYTLRNLISRIYHRWSLHKANIIISVSEKTKRDTINFFKVSAEKIKVVYWGFSNICTLKEKTSEVPQKFFLSVGVLKKRKNALTTLKAFAEFANYNTEYHLVLAGKGSGSYYENLRNFIQENNLQDRVHFLGFVSDEQLSFLYKKAKALVFPSLIEGFGFTVLEASSCGLPVITSRNTSLEEITGGSAILVDPKNVEELRVALIQIIEQDEKVAKKRIDEGLSNAKNFNWEKTAGRYLDIINETIS